MPFGDTTDRNAQRAEQTATPALQVGGGVQNQTLGGMGLQDVSSATATAQALGKLTKDVMQTVSGIQQKEAYVEAYANAGAGRSVKEIRDEQPAWETIFGPSATVQGAQARALQTASADFGNEAFSMIDTNKDMDPAAFHKKLAAGVGKHLTGDSITDTLITQAATEKVTEIAAMHYKVHSKYVQELNVQAYTSSVGATLKTLELTLAQPEDVRSPEGDAKAHAALDEVLKKPAHMDALSHQKKNVELLINDLSRGSLILRDKLMPELSPSAAEDAAIQAGDSKYAAGERAKLEVKKKNYNAKLSLGENPGAPTFTPTDEDRAEIHAAYEKGQDLINERRSTEVAAHIVALENRAESGEGWKTLIPAINNLDGKGFDLTLGQKEGILRKHLTASEGNQKLALSAEAYRKFYPDKEGQQVVFAQIRQHADPRAVGFVSRENPNGIVGAAGEEAVLRNISQRPDVIDENLKALFQQGLSAPLLQDGAKNPRFDDAFLKFRELWRMNKEVALSYLPENKRVEYRDGMRDYDANTATAETLAKQFSSSRQVTAEEMRASVGSVSIELMLRKLTNNQWYNLMPSVTGTKKTAITPYMRNTVAQDMARLKQGNPGGSDESISAQAMSNFWKSHESIGGNAQPIGTTSFTQRMQLADPKATADDALEHYKEKLKWPYMQVVTHDNVVELHKTDKHGNYTDNKPVFIKYTELGSILNREVTAPDNALHDRAQGRSNDAKLEARLDGLDYAYRKQGKVYTRTELASMDRAALAAGSKVVNAGKNKIGGIVAHSVTSHDTKVKKFGRKLKKFWDTHEFGLPDLKHTDNPVTYE